MYRKKTNDDDDNEDEIYAMEWKVHVYLPEITVSIIIDNDMDDNMFDKKQNNL